MSPAHHSRGTERQTAEAEAIATTTTILISADLETRDDIKTQLCDASVDSVQRLVSGPNTIICLGRRIGKIISDLGIVLSLVLRESSQGAVGIHAAVKGSLSRLSRCCRIGSAGLRIRVFSRR